MNKAGVGLIVVLSCLLGVQTYRIHRLSGSAVGDAAAVRVAGPKGTADDALGALPAVSDSVTTAEGDEDEISLEVYVEQIERRDVEAGVGGAGVKPAGDRLASVAGGPAAEKRAENRRKSPEKRGKDVENARKTAEKKRKAEAVQRLVRRARDAMAQGDFQAAADLLNQGIESDPGNADSYRNLAKLYRTLGLSDEELQTYADWSEQRPNDASPYYQQARLLASLGRGDEALPYLQQFQQLAGDEPGSYPMAASVYRQLNMRGQEGSMLEAWAASTPNSPDAHRALAQWYARNGDRAGAVNEYEALVQLTPENVRAYRELAQAYQRAQDFGAAQSALISAIGLQPENMQLRIQLGQAYKQNGQIEAALQAYYEVLAAAPGTREAVQASRAIYRIERQAGKPVNQKRA